MSAKSMDPVFASALRDELVAVVKETKHFQWRWSWRLGLGALAASTALAGGVAVATGVFSQPGAPSDTALGNVVTATRTGTAIVELGPAPAGTTNISLTLTCLSVGSFGYPDGSSMSCSAEDLTHPAPLDRTSMEVVPFQPGGHSVTITTTPGASWTLQALYINRVVTPWATNAGGETYGVPNKSGWPDLISVVIDDGQQHGYVKSSDLDCASGRVEVHSPAEALEWDAASKNRNVSVPVYESDGSTIIGTYLVGEASGRGSLTVPVSSLYPEC
jgi:hypothetical protein